MAFALSACATAGSCGEAAVELAVDCTELRSGKTLEREARLAVGQTLVVSLCSNATTGHRWAEQAAISEPAALSQLSQSFEPPTLPIPGAPGRQRWTFRALAMGETRVRFVYRQPWMRDADPAWSVDLLVRVRGSEDGGQARAAEGEVGSLSYTLVRHPVSGAEVLHVSVPGRQEIERKVNEQLDAQAAAMMCTPEGSAAKAPFETDVRVTHAADDVLSVSIRASYFCGGAHPTNGADHSLSFDLMTAQAVPFRALFEDYARDFPNIAQAYVASLPPERRKACADHHDLETLGAYRFGYTLSSAGLSVTPGFPHAFAACADEATVPFARIRTLAAPESILTRVADAAV